MNGIPQCRNAFGVAHNMRSVAVARTARTRSGAAGPADAIVSVWSMRTARTIPPVRRSPRSTDTEDMTIS